MAGFHKFSILGHPRRICENLLWRNLSHEPLPLCQMSSLCVKRCRRNASLSPAYVPIIRTYYTDCTNDAFGKAVLRPALIIIEACLIIFTIWLKLTEFNENIKATSNIRA